MTGFLPFDSRQLPSKRGQFPVAGGNRSLGPKSLRPGPFSGIFLVAAKCSFIGGFVLSPPPEPNVQIARPIALKEKPIVIQEPLSFYVGVCHRGPSR